MEISPNHASFREGGAKIHIRQPGDRDGTSYVFLSLIWVFLIYSPTNIAYMSRWMAKIQFKPNKEEQKIAKESQAKAWDVPCCVHPSGVHMHSRIAHQI